MAYWLFVAFIPASVAKLCGMLVGRPTIRRVLMQCSWYTYWYVDLSQNGAENVQVGECEVSRENDAAMGLCDG